MNNVWQIDFSLWNWIYSIGWHDRDRSRSILQVHSIVQRISSCSLHHLKMCRIFRVKTPFSFLYLNNIIKSIVVQLFMDVIKANTQRGAGVSCPCCYIAAWGSFCRKTAASRSATSQIGGSSHLSYRVHRYVSAQQPPVSKCQ